MARTRAFGVLRRCIALAIEAEREPSASTATRGRPRVSRRQVLQGTLVGAAGALASSCATTSRPTHLSGAFASTTAPRIAIVGAGTAGLLCAYRLQQAGVSARVYDANTRSGGRMYSAGALRDGQVAELGGEFIDTGHRTLQRVAAELGLRLDDVHAGNAALRQQTFYFAGRVVTEAQIVEALGPLSQRVRADLQRAQANPQEFERIDALSVTAYLQGAPDVDTLLKTILLDAYRGEFGLEPDEQSAWNLVALLGMQAADAFELFGESDERFRVRGGNEQVPKQLAARLHEGVQLGHRLARIRERGDKSLQLSFERDGTSLEQAFDTVVLALPFTQLRRVELRLELPARKREVIAQLGYGSNAKLMGQFGSRVWRTSGATGYTITDLAPQALWDTSWPQPGEAGLLTCFVGGKTGVELAAGGAEERMRAWLGDIDRIYPGSLEGYLPGSALRMAWPTSPCFLGSYACYRPGQAKWAGSEGQRVGQLHFCGEHTSRDFQGFMEGAAESGERAAREVLSALGLMRSRT